MTTRVDSLIIGAGQAGLALSRCLTEHGREHVLLDRGRVAERWRSERWDSFRLLTPNWHTRLPGFRYQGDDPAGFMTGSEVVDLFESYVDSFSPPVRSGVTVTTVEPTERGRWQVRTDAGLFEARDVVVATGNYDRAYYPALAAELPVGVHQLHTSRYRGPNTLPPGGVLVVGAGPSGQQVALELALAGRTVHLSVGHHRPLPRRYRGRDVFEWMDVMGLLDRTVDSLPARAAGQQHAPSVVVAGGTSDLNLHRLVASGVTPVGRMVSVSGGRMQFADDLPDRLSEADGNVVRLCDAVDAYVEREQLDVVEEARPSGGPQAWAASAPREVDLEAAGITTVVWATGFRRDFSWVHAPVFDDAGEFVQRRGTTASPGLHVLGMRWLWKRKSNFIDGVGEDAEFLAESIATNRAMAGVA